jgi:predicted nucleotidyltransferase component of viral defense system
MSSLPSVPETELLADVCRETAARERIQPEQAEKDLYLTRLLWALGDRLEDGLVLKGGALLSKVDLGFFRLSEDADLVIPGVPDRSKQRNVRTLAVVRDGLKSLAPAIGVRVQFPGGEVSDRGTHAVWELEYDSVFGRQGIRLEVSIRPVLRLPRRVVLRQLVVDPLIGKYDGATCWALDEAEARAEKVRAAFTRTAIRDFYDLDRMLHTGADFTSHNFIGLVDAKLSELKAGPLADKPRSFGLDARRKADLEGALQSELPAILRVDAPPFDLDAMLAKFDGIWGK